MQASSRRETWSSRILTTCSIRCGVAKHQRTLNFVNFHIFQKYVIFQKNKNVENMWVFSMILNRFLKFTAEKWEREKHAGGGRRPPPACFSAAEGRRSHFSPVNFKKWLKIIEKTHMFSTFLLCDNRLLLHLCLPLYVTLLPRKSSANWEFHMKSWNPIKSNIRVEVWGLGDLGHWRHIFPLFSWSC